MEERKLEFEAYKKRIDDIVRNGRDINFVDIKTDIELTIDFFLAYYSSEKYQARFTQNQRQDIENYCYRPFAQAVNQILSRTDWQNVEHERYRANIREAYHRLLEQGYLTRIEAAKGADNNALNDFAEMSKELIAEQKASLDAAQSAAAQAFENLEVQRTDVDRKIKQINAKAEKAAKSLAKQVSSENGKVFLDESDAYKNTANRWLIALIFVVATAAALLSWLFIDLSTNPETLSSNLIFSGLKVSALVVIIYLIQITTRNYNTNKHLETINRQRATVIAFINTFVNSVENEAYKDYLLTYAAKTVFDHGETGFISRNYGAGTSNEDGLDIILNNISKFKQ